MGYAPTLFRKSQVLEGIRHFGFKLPNLFFARFLFENKKLSLDFRTLGQKTFRTRRNRVSKKEKLCRKSAF